MNNKLLTLYLLFLCMALIVGISSSVYASRDITLHVEAEVAENNFVEVWCTAPTRVVSPWSAYTPGFYFESVNLVLTPLPYYDYMSSQFFYLNPYYKLTGQVIYEDGWSAVAFESDEDDLRHVFVKCGDITLYGTSKAEAYSILYTLKKAKFTTSEQYTNVDEKAVLRTEGVRLLGNSKFETFYTGDGAVTVYDQIVNGMCVINGFDGNYKSFATLSFLHDLSSLEEHFDAVGIAENEPVLLSNGTWHICAGDGYTLYVGGFDGCPLLYGATNVCDMKEVVHLLGALTCKYSNTED